MTAPAYAGEENELDRTEDGGEESVLSLASSTGVDAGRATESTSKLTIAGHGLTFEREIPDSLVLRIMTLVITGETEPEGRASGSGSETGRESTPGGRREALAEFYRRAAPKKYPEKLTTIAAYLQQTVGRQSFTPDDLKGQFRAVNEPPPANMPRDFKGAMGEGWIAEEHDQPGQYFVTRSGLEAVNAGFSADATRKPTKARRRKRPTKAATNGASNGGE